jgi:hypothetical protein
VISANQHGYMQTRFPVTLAVCCDKKHCKERVPMGPFLRQWTDKMGGAIVSRWSFADYRLGDWRFVGNSGLTAVAVAAALGCNPIIATGLDFWATGREYFHEPTAQRSKRAPAATALAVHQRKKVGSLEQFTNGANIRALSGPMAAVFGRYDPLRKLPAHKPIAYRRAHFGEADCGFQAPAGFRLANQDLVPAGHYLALTADERKVLQVAGQLG